MKSRIIIFGSSCNPLGNHHLNIIRSLVEIFGKVIVYPCGARPKQKPSTNLVSRWHKKNLVRLALSGQDGVDIDLHDLDFNEFTPTWLIDQRYRAFSDIEVWHVIGGDLIKEGATGNSEIQTTWEKGKEIWQNLNWIVIDHPNCPIDPADLPPKSILIKIDKLSGRSSDIRERIQKGLSVTGLVPKEVEKYIVSQDLYRPQQ